MKIKLLTLICVASLVICGCAQKSEPKEITHIPAFTKNGKLIDMKKGMRWLAIRETALSIGSQAGLAWRSREINRMLTWNSEALNQTFDFQQLILDHDVLPPVLEEGDTLLNLDSDSAIRLADKVYKIVFPPRFMTTPPIWRNYLWMNYEKPQILRTNLPTNAEERQVWNNCIVEGWQNGIEQAEQIFSANLGRLRRDYNGMILYRILLAQNMVSPPFVAKTELGVTGGPDEMRVNDRILRIVAISELNPHSREWKPAIAPEKPYAQRWKTIHQHDTPYLYDHRGRIKTNKTKINEEYAKFFIK